jgi:hypothetical protein
MAHARQTIREAAKSLLTGLTTTGTNVFESRIYSFDVVPCLTIYSTRESIQKEGATLGDVVRRELTLMVEGRSMPPEGGGTPDDQLDTIAAEVEKKIADNRALGVGVQFSELTDTQIELSGALERPSGIVRLSFRVLYRTVASTPTAIVP